ncbi:MAG: DUF2017 family protein [Acidimicrobiales bacterium]
MIFRSKRLFQRTGPGRFKVELPQHLRDFLVQLGGELDAALDHDHPALTRLFPTAYPDDAEKDAGYQVFAHGELIDQRREAIALLTNTANDTDVDLDTLSSWMRVINDTRLVLGTLLDVSEFDETPPSEPTSNRSMPTNSSAICWVKLSTHSRPTSSSRTTARSSRWLGELDAKFARYRWCSIARPVTLTQPLGASASFGFTGPHRSEA